MKTYLDCYPCFLRQSLEAARMAGADESQQYRIFRAVARDLGVPVKGIILATGNGRPC